MYLKENIPIKSHSLKVLMLCLTTARHYLSMCTVYYFMTGMTYFDWYCFFYRGSVVKREPLCVCVCVCACVVGCVGVIVCVACDSAFLLGEEDHRDREKNVIATFLFASLCIVYFGQTRPDRGGEHANLTRSCSDVDLMPPE